MSRQSENQGPPLARLDWLLIAAAVAVACAGWAALRGGAEGNAVLLVAAQRQLLWLGLGGMVILLVQFFDYQKIARFTPLFYVLNLMALVAVLILGSRIKGSRAWFDLGPFSFQPSETMKVVVAMALAQWFALRPEGQSSLRDLVVPAAIAGVPVGLVLMQPDLGTALVFGAMFMGMLFWSGVPRKILIGMITAVLITGAIGYPFLKSYQRERILVFVNPERDPKGAGYNVIQSKIAVGAGGLTGAGLKRGTQTTLRFLPEHHNDFIFASFAEQFGLLGVCLVLAGYGVIATRIVAGITEARDRFGSLLIAGLGTVFLTHALFNMSMILGMVPVTGLPLPLMSYGGSFMLTTCLSLGLIINVGSRKFLFA